MNVLITGWSGFIGKAVTDKLDLQGIRWIPFKGDVLCPDDFKRYNQFDVLLHLAGIVRTGPTYEEQKHLLDVNIIGTLNALGFAIDKGTRLLFPSTCSYANSNTYPIPENNPLTYHDPYSYSKWACEQSISAWNKFFGLEGIVFRIFNAYGPDQPSGFLIPDIVNMIRTGKISLLNLTPIRDFIYIDDLADLIARTIITPQKGLITINAGSGVGHSVKEVINFFFDLLGKKLPVDNEERPVFIKKSIADVEYAKKLFGWYHKTGLREGISSVLKSKGIL